MQILIPRNSEWETEDLNQMRQSHKQQTSGEWAFWFTEAGRLSPPLATLGFPHFLSGDFSHTNTKMPHTSVIQTPNETQIHQDWIKRKRKSHLLTYTLHQPHGTQYLLPSSCLQNTVPHYSKASSNTARLQSQEGNGNPKLVLPHFCTEAV